MYHNIFTKKFHTLQNLCKNKNVVIQKPDNSKSVANVDKTDYSEKIENLLNDTRKFEKNNN